MPLGEVTSTTSLPCRTFGCPPAPTKPYGLIPFERTTLHLSHGQPAYLTAQCRPIQAHCLPLACPLRLRQAVAACLLDSSIQAKPTGSGTLWDNGALPG